MSSGNVRGDTRVNRPRTHSRSRSAREDRTSIHSISDSDLPSKRSREKKTRTTSESSRDSSQGSLRALKDAKDNKKEKRIPKSASVHSLRRENGSDAENVTTERLKKNKKKEEKTATKEESGHLSADSGCVKDAGSPKLNMGKNGVSVEPSEEDQMFLSESNRTPRPPLHSLDPSRPVRLLVLSSKIKNSTIMQNALLGNVIMTQYKYESSTLDSLLSSIHQSIHQQGDPMIETIAFIVHTATNTVYLTGKDDKVLNSQTVKESIGIRDFFSNLAKIHMDLKSKRARIDFLSCNTANSTDVQTISSELEAIVKVPVGFSKDVAGIDIKINDSKASCLGELYFRLEKLRNWSAHNQQTLAGFEKIRTVGKGAYGTAVLYRKKDDDSLVILKEINLHDLNASERQLALNEVKVLAMLDHPNIISYYDSFEEEGIVMIEMEYADGGTLAQYLSQQDKPLDEREVLAMFQQVVAAIKHIHEHNILHRDLKTANIFLTKEGVVKVGDFGISKLLSTANQANTVLGTPYYISPEMCEGKNYNEKSDIWALGCILYEMACLQKTFEGSNLPALVNKIMKGQFAPVKGTYSVEFKNLIQDMLQRDPENRPSSSELWHNRLPEMLSKYEDPVTDYEDDTNGADGVLGSKKRKTRVRVRSRRYSYWNPILLRKESYIRIMSDIRSVLYYFEMTNMSLTPIELPSKVKIRDVAVGSDHVAVVTVERMVYTWGDGSMGQLAHGDLESRAKPQSVESLQGKSIVRACCGTGFSVFASDNGIVMTSGEGSSGCLGHGDWCSTSRPRLIEALLSVDVVAIACGPEHVIAVGSEGEVFSWGQGAGGRLGLGSDENVCVPTEVVIQDSVCVRDVRCGLDGSMLISDVGSVLACGNNQYNKLGLNQRQGFLMAMKNIFNKTEVEGQKVFTLVKALARHRVVDISLGPDHSAVVVEPGHVYTLGRNAEGQLGNANTKLQNAPIGVKLFYEKPAFRVQCGPGYSVGGTTENDLLFWGLRYKTPPLPKLDESLNSSGNEYGTNRGHSRLPSSASISSAKSAMEDLFTEGVESNNNNKPPSAGARSLPTERQNSRESIYSEQGGSFSSGGFRPLSSTHQRRNLSTLKENQKDAYDQYELILQPTPLLRMDASGTHSEAGDTVTLSNFYCHGENLFIEVETTAPAPKRKSKKKRHLRKRFSSNNLEVPEGTVRTSASSREGGDEYSSEASEHDTFGTIPAWLKEELARSELDPNDDNEADVSDYDQGFHPDASMTSIQINKDLKNTGKMAPARINRVSKGGVGPGGKDARHKTSQHTNPAEVKDNDGNLDQSHVDPLSSSSSSDPMNQNYASSDKNKPAPVMKKLTPAPPRKLAAPVPYKSKLGPSPGQKPLNRIRANKQRSRGSGEMAKDMSAEKGDPTLTKVGTQSLYVELERLKQEKSKTEQRLRTMETEHRKQKQLLEKHHASSTQEEKLKEEVSYLKGELAQQSSALQSNYQMVQSLQEQLEKIQSEQMRQSARDNSSERSNTSQSVQKESRICSVQ